VLVTDGDGFTNAAAGLVNKPPNKLDAGDYLAISRFRQNQTLTVTALQG
jgi:hypothetical protein